MVNGCLNCITREHYEALALYDRERNKKTWAEKLTFGLVKKERLWTRIALFSCTGEQGVHYHTCFENGLWENTRAHLAFQIGSPGPLYLYWGGAQYTLHNFRTDDWVISYEGYTADAEVFLEILLLTDSIHSQRRMLLTTEELVAGTRANRHHMEQIAKLIAKLAEVKQRLAESQALAVTSTSKLIGLWDTFVAISHEPHVKGNFGKNAFRLLTELETAIKEAEGAARLTAAIGAPTPFDAVVEKIEASHVGQVAEVK